MIRVLVVDDSPLFRRMFVAVLQKDPDLRVVAVAQDGLQGVALAQEHRPDVITMDVNMPVMGGYEATVQIMARFPTPIVILTGSPSKQQQEAIVKALGMGAVDVLAKPNLSDQPAVQAMVAKIKQSAGAHVIRHVAGLQRPRLVATGPAAPPGSRSIVAIAASAGGPAALARLFSLLPASLGAPIVVAQHLSIGFGATLVQWLGSLTQLQVCEGADDQALRPGLVVIAPAGRHMEVAEEGRVRLSDAPPVHGCRPSADVLFDSVARLYGASAVAAILTGMGQDGALGLKAIKAAGGRTLAQDEATSVIFGMPKAAIQLGAVDRVLPLDSLAEEIARLVGHCPASTASAS